VALPTVQINGNYISGQSYYLVTGVSGKPIGDVFKDAETSVTDYQLKPRNITEE